MSLETRNIVAAVEKAMQSEKRGFTQSLDLIVNLRDMDMKKNAGKLNETVELPNPVTKKTRVCVIGSGQMLIEAKKAGADGLLQREDLDNLGRDKKAARKIAREYGVFVAETPLMPVVGKTIGAFLGPRGKMPTPIPPNSPLGPVLERSRKIVRIRLKDQPTIQCRVGSEDMPPEKVADNIQTIIRRLEEKLERGSRNIGEVLIKATMGSPIKVTAGEKKK